MSYLDLDLDDISSNPFNAPSGEPTVEMPPWLLRAYKYLGLKEFPGKKHNSTIIRWWKEIRQGFTDDETPWCAAFVGGVLEEVGIVSSRKANARSYSSWGIELKQPAVGAIVVFWRGTPSGYKGHVAFLVGMSKEGNPIVLGGNQGDAVSLKEIPASRVLGYRWPKGSKLPSDYTLPIGMAALTNDNEV